MLKDIDEEYGGFKGAPKFMMPNNLEFLLRYSVQNLKKFGSDLTKIGIKIGVVMCIIGFIFYYPLGRIFNNDPVVLQEFYNIFWIVLAMLPLCSIAFIFDGIYKGLGWMKDLRNVLLFSTFIVFVPFVILFDNYDLGLHGIFYAFTLWILARSIPLIIKFKKTFN